MATKKNIFQHYWSRLPAPLRNRYFIAIGVFFVFMVMVDRHDLMTQWKLNSTVNRLERDQVFYEEMIERAREERLDREINRERFARESYFMQKDNEDVFIIVDEDVKRKE
ncbi:MAG: hypothetical protein WBA17_08310 [Saprospiraceae bacterium]